MTLIVDAAPLVALADRRDPQRDAVRALFVAEPGALIVPAQVTAEVDYLLGRRIGRAARIAFLDDLAVGRFVVEALDRDEYAAVVSLENQYPEFDVGLADGAVAVLAARFDTRRLATFDQPHFRTIRPLQGGTFELLPEQR